MATAKADLTAKEKAEAAEGAPYPSPYASLDERLKTVETLLKTLKDKLDAAVLTPAAHDARLNALEVSHRAMASDVVSRATAMAAAAPPAKVK